MQHKLFQDVNLDDDRMEAVRSSICDRIRDINFVSFSGGKDSTTVLQLVFDAFMRAGRGKLYVVTADTMMEIPYFKNYVDAVKRRIDAFIVQHGLRAEIVTVMPAVCDSFWVSVIGKGYPAASMGFRWCTGRLKIDPIQKFTKAATQGNDDHMVFVGVRSGESALRARIYKRKDFRPNHFAPILDWSAHDVWEFLLTEPCTWGGDHSALLNVYKYSSDECVYGESQGVCVGNARYGCWACPLQKSSQLSKIGANTDNRERYELLKQFKEMLVNMAADHSLRSRIRRNGNPGVGPFLVNVRKIIYSRLKELESATGFNLITPAEEAYIFSHWEMDRDVHDISAKRIINDPLFQAQCIAAEGMT